MSDSFREQRINIQPCAKLEKYANKISDMIKNFCNPIEMSRTIFFDSYKFRESRKDKRDDW